MSYKFSLSKVIPKLASLTTLSRSWDDIFRNNIDITISCHSGIWRHTPRYSMDFLLYHTDKLAFKNVYTMYLLLIDCFIRIFVLSTDQYHWECGTLLKLFKMAEQNFRKGLVPLSAL